MQTTLNYNIYSVKYCSVAVPKELCDLEVPSELEMCAVDEYARLKDGIEVTEDSLGELVQSNEFNDINPKWRKFLKEVLKIEADAYIFHN